MIKVLRLKPVRLFIFLSGIFITNALVAEFVGTKIFQLESTLGFHPVSYSFFGQGSLSFQLTAGVLLWPIIFVLTDVINEYFGKRGVKFISFLTAGLIAYSFIMFYAAIQLVPADWWVASAEASGVPDMDLAFGKIFGQGMWIIVASLVAFLVGQLVDVLVFQKIKRLTGQNFVWLRATGSTLISQLIDSFLVLFIAFYIGANWPLNQIFAIGTMNYIYKFLMAILLTPLIYLAHFLIDRYLGKERAERMKATALKP